VVRRKGQGGKTGSGKKERAKEFVDNLRYFDADSVSVSGLSRYFTIKTKVNPWVVGCTM
jgi:hypothetical protein